MAGIGLNTRARAHNSSHCPKKPRGRDKIHEMNRIRGEELVHKIHVLGQHRNWRWAAFHQTKLLWEEPARKPRSVYRKSLRTSNRVENVRLMSRARGRRKSRSAQAYQKSGSIRVALAGARSVCWSGRKPTTINRGSGIRVSPGAPLLLDIFSLSSVAARSQKQSLGIRVAVYSET